MSADHRSFARAGAALGVAIAALTLFMLPFAHHAATFGVRGLTGHLASPTYLHVAGAWLSNASVFAHMVAGAVVTAFAPLQLVAWVRSRRPAFHRVSGYVVGVCAIFAAAAGLGFIALRGTIGGPAMDAGFAGYGVCLAAAALQTLRFARKGVRDRHRAWAIRLFVLVIGSWIYRLHYTLWFLITGGLGSTPDFSGPFDRIQNFAFYAPYLIAVEVWLRRRGRTAPHQAVGG